MSKFIGVPCPICNKSFTQNDDIVVCPICGAPYHRHCYNENSKCIFDNLHNEGKDWEIPEIKLPETAPAYEVKDQECMSCGVLNARSSLFCSSCGSSLKMKPDVHNNRINTNAQPNFPMNGFSAIAFDPLGGVPATDTIEDNINYGEVSKVVRQNTRYYIPIFNKIKNTNRSSFNFSAFLFSGGWLLFRKQYKTGIIYTAIMFMLYLAQSFISLYISYPKITEMFESAGITIDESGLTVEQMLEYSASTNIVGMDLLIISLPTFISILMFGIMLFLGIKGNRMYMKHCIKLINTTRTKSTNLDDYNAHILEKSGVDTTVTVCLLICYLIVSYIPLFF